MIVKTQFHTSFGQNAVLCPLFSVTTNVAIVSILDVKCQRFGMDTDRYISVGNTDLVVFRSSGRPTVSSSSPPPPKPPIR
jgi:hypothetical protein